MEQNRTATQFFKPLSKPLPEPYRFLFPIGLVAAVCGVLLWVFYKFQILHFYPMNAHGNLLFFGFFGSFVSGFLMTAIPKMTGARPASWIELGLAAILPVSQICLAFFNLVQVQIFVYFLQLLFLLWFVVSRIAVHKKIPFEGFYFIPFSFIWAFFSLYLYVTQNISLSKFYTFAGEAFLMNLICGLGSRLIPVVARLPGALLPSANLSGHRLKYLAFSLIMNLIFVGYLLDYLAVSNLLFGIYLIVFSFVFLRLHKKPLQIGYLGLALKISWGLMIFVKLMLVIYPGLALPLQHIFYIGGIFLITLLIGTRVMLAHAGQDLNYELNGKVVLGTLLFLLAAAVLRFFARNDVLGNFISSAIICFLLANFVWGYKFFAVLKNVRAVLADMIQIKRLT